MLLFHLIFTLYTSLIFKSPPNMKDAPLTFTHVTRPVQSSKENSQNQKPGVVFMLHGYGSNEHDLFSFSNQIPEDLFVISLRAPLDLPPSGHAWYTIHWDTTSGKFNDIPEAKKAILDLEVFIKAACEKYNLDATNVTLLGFSQGCILSLALALENPSLIKNVIGLSGYLDPNMLTEKSVHTPNETSALNIFVSHGTLDEVIPIDWARKTPEVLAQFGVTTHLREYPIGHGVSMENLQDFVTWLNANK